MAARCLDRFIQIWISRYWSIIIRHVIAHWKDGNMPYPFMYVLERYSNELAKGWVDKINNWVIKHDNCEHGFPSFYHIEKGVGVCVGCAYVKGQGVPVRKTFQNCLHMTDD